MLRTVTQHNKDARDAEKPHPGLRRVMQLD